MRAAPDFREMNRRVFQRAPAGGVLFQPRFEPWFARNERLGTLPDALQGRTLVEAFDLVGASMRYMHYYTGQPDPVESRFVEGVAVSAERADGERRVRYETPEGALTERYVLSTDSSWRLVDFAVRGPGDLPALVWLLERRQFSFNAATYERGAEFVGRRGVPQFWLPKSPYFALAQQWMRYQDFVYAMADSPEVMQRAMDAIDRSYDPLYEQIIASGRPEIVNFGENVAMAFLSPRYFERYCVPWYERRSGQLRDAGIFTHIHIDGDFRPLLPRLARLPFDGLEALTPEPQGDVTLEEMREHMGDKVLLDGIPAVLFLDHYPRDQFQACVERVVELFHPRLVLGVSDELPEGGGDEAWRRLAWAADYCRRRGDTGLLGTLGG